MADKRISQLVERVTLATNDVFPIVASGATTTNKVTLQTIDDYMQTNLDFGVTSVAISVPTGLSVTGTPITSTGTFVITFTAGYSIPTTAKQTEWDTAYTNRITSATAPLGIASNVISITQSGASTDGYLSSTDWNTFNNKQSTITTGNLTEATSSVLTITGGTGAVLGSGTSIQVKQASGSQDGFLDSADWTTFNDKQNALSGTGIVKSTGGTISYLTDNTSNWDSAYNDKINSASVTGTTTKTLTLTQQDGGTITTTWTDLDTGTVTSVGVSMPSAFSVANSPITSSGTISITGAGTISQYIDGTGALRTFPTIIAETTRLVREVYNNSGTTMTKGTVVYINGGQGNLPTIARALATGDATSAQTYGVVQTSIGNMSNGYIVVVGDLIDMDTQAFVEGTQLYLSPTTAGEYTSTKPYAPQHLVYVGIVTRSHPTQGIIAIKIQNGFEMDELHNVSAQNPNNNDILQYKTATNLWTKVAGSTTNIAEGTNLYYTNARARAAFSESVTGLDYDSITGVLSTTTGYGIPTAASQTNWDAAYNDKINSAAVTGTTTKTLTLTQQDGGTITASWTDINTDAVTSVFGRPGPVVATSGDYNTDQVTEGTSNLYFTNARSRSSISLTTTGTSGAATYNSTTGVLNIPSYVGGVTSVNTLTGAVVLTTSNIAEGTNLYYTDTRARAAISLTTTGTSGAATYSGGVLNIPNYSFAETDTLASVVARGSTTTATISVGNSANGLTGINIKRGRLCFSGSYEPNHSIFNNLFDLDGEGAWDGMKMETFLGLDIKTGDAPTGVSSTILAVRPAGVTITGNVTATNLSGTNTGDQTLSGLGGVPTSRTLTINGTAYDLSANRSWTISAGGTDTLADVTGRGATTTTSITANRFISNATDVGGEWYFFRGNSSVSNALTMYTYAENVYTNAYKSYHIRANNTGGTGGYIFMHGGSVMMGTANAPLVHSNSTGVVIQGSARGILEVWDATSGKSVFQNVGGNTYIGQLDKGTGAGITYIMVNGSGTSADVALTLNADTSAVFNTSVLANSWIKSNTFLGVTRAGANGVGEGPYVVIAQPTSAIQWLMQLNASAGLDYWHYNGSAWSIPLKLQTNGFVSIGGVGAASKLTIYDGDIRLYKPHVIAGGASWKANINFTDEVDRLGARITGERTAWDGAPMGLGFDTGGVGTVTRRMTITQSGVNFGSNNSSIIGADGGDGYFYSYSGGVPKIYIEAGGTVAFLNTGGTFVGTTTRWNGEKFGVQTSNAAGWASIPSLVRLTNYTSGGVTKITFTDSSIIDGWIGMVPISGGSYFALGFSGYSEQGFKVYQNGSVVAAGDVTAYSDARLKTNVNTIDNALDKVLSLRGVTYNRIDVDIDKKKMGVIAQEVLDILPEVVSKDNEGMYSVSYGNMVGVLIEAVKEQQKQIDKLKKQVA